MIKNRNEIIAQNIKKSESILVDFTDELANLDNKSNININTVEKTLGNTISSFIGIGLQISGEVLSNIEVNNHDKYCSCGKKLITPKRGVQTHILSMYGYIPFK